MNPNPQFSPSRPATGKIQSYDYVMLFDALARCIEGPSAPFVNIYAMVLECSAPQKSKIGE